MVGKRPIRGHPSGVGSLEGCIPDHPVNDPVSGKRFAPVYMRFHVCDLESSSRVG
jgi:hypothetical protein